MRIIAGTHRGRRLLTPGGQDIRPTSDKIRGAIFNALRARGAVAGAVVLDGFCGTGALGLEALSQGAARCVFVDNARTSLDLARKNAVALGLEDRCEFRLSEMAKFGQIYNNKEKFDLILLDPPYHKNLIPEALSGLAEAGLVMPGAIALAESGRGENLVIPQAYALLDERIYGETKIVMLAYTSMPE